MGGSLTGLRAPGHHLYLLPCFCGGEGLGLGNFAANRRRHAGRSPDEETQALFAAVMSFWFSSRQISKMRRGG